VPWITTLFAISTLLVSQDEYRERRAKLRASLPGSAILLMGAPDNSSDPRNPLLQEPNFFYLTGWLEPGAALLILPESEQPNEVLFLPPRSERKERYEGRRAAAGDPGVGKLTGFAAVMSTDAWENETRIRTRDLKPLYSLKNVPAMEQIQRATPSAEWNDVSASIARLRMVKSAREVELIQHSIDVSVEAHQAAWKRAKAGLFEYQIAATMTQVMLDSGCERNAYRPVVGSGPNSVILHYGANRRRMDRGEVLLMDVGAECGAYAADITRTIPVGGRFNARQRELYDLVLGAQKAAISAVKPGTSISNTGELLRAAKEYMDAHGKPINGKPPSHYLTHGIGHHVGLEVHDAAINGEPLAPGMVITIEPGLYIPEEGIGIRIEDMVLVTRSGGKVLSDALPREAADIERRIGH
jgi:Xaa-Pro aminopeptidase